jgi:hypothetical protein
MQEIDMDTTKTWLAMAMPIPFHLDTLPSHLCLSTLHHLAKHDAKDLLDPPVLAIDHEDDDRTRTSRAQISQDADDVAPVHAADVTGHALPRRTPPYPDRLRSPGYSPRHV